MTRGAYYAFLFGVFCVNTVSVFSITITEDTVFNDDSDYGTVNVNNNARVDMFNGQIENLITNGTSEFYLHDGRIGSYYAPSPISAAITDDSKFFQYDGKTDQVRLRQNGQAYIYAGELEYASLYEDSKIFIYGEVEVLYANSYDCDAHIFGYGHQYAQSNTQHPSLPNGYTYSLLRVFKNIAQTEYYDVKLIDHIPTMHSSFEWQTYDRIIFHEIPEPTTISLLALGAFLAGRRRRV